MLEAVAKHGLFDLQIDATGDIGAFKTPALRDISKTGPYMHTGALKTLEEVVEHYNLMGPVKAALESVFGPLEPQPLASQIFCAVVRPMP